MKTPAARIAPRASCVGRPSADPNASASEAFTSSWSDLRR
ncbi:hypothetical protein C7S16_2420 [Burkholderia thailandensis]|uniref:Uncharacterized protein n=1 Tax=Burkholderia thailandensis TaxID=57975 RepID=A0AAW9D597_BURTH|nr:hypothetical protein [Burkholderia thailandensis]